MSGTRTSGEAAFRARTRRARRGNDQRSFGATARALEALATNGAQVSVHVADLDTGAVVFSGDDFVTLPVADLGAVAVLIETAVRLNDGRLHADECVQRRDVRPPAIGGLWSSLQSESLRLGDLVALCASVSDPAAINALIERVGLTAVRNRLSALGFRKTAVLDSHRDERGLDDAPHLALGNTRELAQLFGRLVNGTVVSPLVSAQVSEWLSRNADLGLVGSATTLDPLSHEDDKHGLLFINKTGRSDGVRAEGGTLAGPRAGASYAMAVVFEDRNVTDRMRVHDAMHTFGMELMEYVH